MNVKGAHIHYYNIIIFVIKTISLSTSNIYYIICANYNKTTKCACVRVLNNTLLYKIDKQNKNNNI